MQNAVQTAKKLKTLIFLSTHPHGVRRQLIFYTETLLCFNPRTRTGCDRLWTTSTSTTESFNPRTRMGCDPPTAPIAVPTGPFQSTHPHRMRPLLRSFLLRRAACFNPRTRTGCDYSAISTDINELRFQSTHPHRVRPVAQLKTTSVTLFQSTHPHGVRRCSSYSRSSSRCVSIHAPARGATALYRLGILKGHCFNPRTRTGCDTAK